ncbi:hypothetical protein [Spartinivicinus poritis]|uniref:Lipoprotein n=1 Tax=Spartinivicinus poritis TaxID=2994640 RepID=A0ABT5UAZ2_9GAMM|nr:hypothetical protein [Spartinivicinus sp. A2-2]MDE1463350.1 hypothetical protein [Spartinivicinus sp. A2-2]
MKKANILTAATLSLLIGGCTTTGNFNIPENSELYIYNRAEPVEMQDNGDVTTRPFFWTAAGIPPGGGIPYRLEQNGQVIKQGRLRTKFRVVSAFWPPFAAIYWPMGFNPDITYDLINDTQE